MVFVEYSKTYSGVGIIRYAQCNPIHGVGRTLASTEFFQKYSIHKYFYGHNLQDMVFVKNSKAQELYCAYRIIMRNAAYMVLAGPLQVWNSVCVVHINL